MGRGSDRVHQVIVHRAEVHKHQRQVADQTAAEREASASPGPATLTLVHAARVATMRPDDVSRLCGDGAADGPTGGYPLPPLVDLGAEGVGWSGWEQVAVVKAWANDRRRAKVLRRRR